MALIKHGNNALANITTFPSAVPTGKPVLISSATASSSASIEFTSGIDSTYDVYQFEFINCHPASGGSAYTQYFSFQGSTNSGSSYGITTTSTWFEAYHNEADTGASLVYGNGNDLAQSTSNIRLTDLVSEDNDSGVSGDLFIFSPSSSTYVKHFMSRNANMYYGGDPYAMDIYCAGYFNSTSPINAFKFLFESGNIDAGTIKLYGISS